MGRARQFFTAIVVSANGLMAGIQTAWPSYTVDQYSSNSTTILLSPMTEVEAALLGSIVFVGCMVGTPAICYLLDNIGRKMSGLALMIPYMLQWTLLSVTSSSSLVLLARVIGGVSGGAGLVFGSLYASEISEDANRGTLTGFPMLFYSTGILFSYVMGWTASYQTINLISLGLSVLLAILSSTVVESPVYFVKINRLQDAASAFEHYWSVPADSKQVREEIARLKGRFTPVTELDNNIKSDEASSPLAECKDSQTKETKPKNIFRVILSQPTTRRALWIVATSMFFQVFSGMIAVQTYAKTIFLNAAPYFSPHLCSCIFSVTFLMACVVATFAVDKSGRRFLLMTSSVMIAICMALLGCCLQTKMGPSWLPALVLLVFGFAYNLGAGPIPYVLMAECFVPEVQTVLSTILVEWVWLVNFILMTIYPFMIKFLTVHGTFYCFAALGVSAALFTYFLIPETKGLSNEVIQDKLTRHQL